MYTIASLVILLLSFWLFRRVAGSMSLTKLNMISWVFYYNIFLQSFIAAVLVINDLDNHYIINRVSDQAELWGWLAVMYTMIAFPIGMQIANIAWGFNKSTRVFNIYINKNLEPMLTKHDALLKVFLYGLSFISVLAVLYTFYHLKSVPIISLLSGVGGESLGVMRIDASRGFAGNSLIRNIFGITMTPILAFISFSYWKLSKKRIDKCWFIIMLISSMLILTYDFSKAPLLSFLLGFMFLSVLINGGISKKSLTIFFVVILSMILGLYVFFLDQSSLGVLLNYNSGFIGRIILSQAAGTYMTFEYFPTIFDHIGFQSVSRFISDFLVVEYVDRSARVIMEAYNPQAVAAGTAGVLNSLFIAEAWANWGIIGVIFSPIYVGFIIQSLYMFFLLSKKTPILLGICTFFTYKGSVTGGANDYLYNAGYAIIITIFVIIYMIFKLRKERSNL